MIMVVTSDCIRLHTIAYDCIVITAVILTRPLFVPIPPFLLEPAQSTLHRSPLSNASRRRPYVRLLRVADCTAFGGSPGVTSSTFHNMWTWRMRSPNWIQRRGLTTGVNHSSERILSRLLAGTLPASTFFVNTDFTRDTATGGDLVY